jgi:hypothetical protein
MKQNSLNPVEINKRYGCRIITFGAKILDLKELIKIS